jgi:hypothetical protein
VRPFASAAARCGWIGLILVSAASEALASAADAPHLPMVGGPGEDADGYPLATVDKRAMLRALRAHRFEQLDAWIEGAQAELEGDWHKEYWVTDAIGAFDQANPALKSLLDAWVQQRPDSWAARAARGAHRLAMGWHERGYDWRWKTPPENFEAMAKLHRNAAPDLIDALKLNPRAITVYTDLLWALTANGAPKILARKVLETAVARCPDCMQARVAYIISLEPRWGGSYARMEAFAAESARGSANPRVRVLVAYADLDRCSMAQISHDLPTAASSCQAAAEVGDYEPFLFARGEILFRIGHADDALVVLDRAIALRPQDRNLLRLHAKVLQHLREYRRYAADVALLREIDPVEGLKPGDVLWAAQGLGYQADMHTRAGQHDDAVTLLRRMVAMQPDNRDAHIRLDAALIRAGRRDEIPPMWDEYLTRHPTDGRAYLERAGAEHHVGREQEAQSDLGAACRFGEAKACDLWRRAAR